MASGSGQGGYQANDRVGQLRGQVDDVRGVMSQNIERVMERGERLDDLVDKTGNLEQNAVKFRQTSRKVKRKMWWKNTKMTLILIVVAIAIILIIIFSVVPMGGGGGGNDPTPAPSTPTLTSTTMP